MPSKCDISVLQEYATKRGGSLLSVEYVNSTSVLSWQCQNGHTFNRKWGTMKSRNTWCTKCSGKTKYTLEEIQKIASSRDGILLSSNYINAHQPLLWKCNKKHTWAARLSDINNNNSWCPTCSKRIKPTIKELQNFAANLKGVLHSSIYLNCGKALNWECEKGHKWSANWNNVKLKGTWCPECASFKTENQVKQLLERKLNIIFTKTRFKYNGKRYELDGYNKEHKIAFEYHGYQHYIYPNHWHRTEDIFKAAQQRDTDKEQYCIDGGIKLIVIPYTITNLDTYINSLDDFKVGTCLQ